MMKSRSEIISTIERQRTWSVAEMAQFLEEALQPGVTVAAVADRHGINRGLFYRWMAKARAGLLPGVSLNKEPAARFVPVRVAPIADPALPKAASPLGTSSGFVEIALGNGRVLKARESIDPAVLGRLAEALDKRVS
jgi:transposase